MVGEGEVHWLNILADAQRHCLAKRYESRQQSYDLSVAPIPAFDLLDMAKYNRLTVQTSRGCPHRCEFCASSVLQVEHYKQKPIRNVLAELDRILKLWPHPFIEFADDNALVNKQYWKELLGQLGRRKFKWFAETDLSVSEDPALLELMRQNGCAQVLIGLESPVADGLAGLELHCDWKHSRSLRYREAIRTIQAQGITVNGCFILGLDGHTLDIFNHVFEFVRDSGLYEVQVTILTPFPGTPLYARLKKENRILDPTAWKKCTLFDVNFCPAQMSPEELAAGFKQLVVKLYNEDFTNQRRNNFRRRLRKFNKKG